MSPRISISVKLLGSAGPGKTKRGYLLIPRAEQDKKLRLKYRDQWLMVIRERGMDRCWECGYDKHFEVIDFHHVIPSGTSRDETRKISFMTRRRKPTLERVRELDKCIPLCANCHREIHLKDKNFGRRLETKKWRGSDSRGNQDTPNQTNA